MRARLDDPTAPQNRALPPLAQQLDIDGGLHDLAPQTRQERLFEPAPFAQLDGQQYLDTDERQETST